MTKIKGASVSDLPVIRQLAKDTWPSAYLAILGQAQLDYMLDKIYSLPSLHQQITELKHNFILVEDGQRAVGFASYSPNKNRTIFHLNKIYVLPDQQGKHVGRQILNYVIEEIKKAGATALRLNVNRHNKARYFYEKQGFQVIKTEDIDIGSGYFMNDYVMQLDL